MKNNQKKSEKKIGGNAKFLFLVIFIYGMTALFNPALVIEALHGFVMMLEKVIPILAFVFVILMTVNLFLKPAYIGKLLGAESGAKGWAYAVVAGMLISGPPYILFPLMREFKENGARNSLLAVFLYNRNVKIQFIPAMILYFGMKYTVILSIYIILFSLAGGKLTEYFAGPE